MRIASSKILLEGTPEPGWIDVENGVIRTVGRGDPGPDARDFGDRLVTPAFVNAHTHVALIALRGRVGSALSGNVVEDLFYRIESQLTAADVRAFARIGAWESLLAGVGLIWDHYFFGAALAEGIADTGLAAVVGPTLQDRSGPGAAQWEAQLQATFDLAADSRPHISAALAPHATDTVSDELWKRIAKEAEVSGLPVHLHLAQSPEEHARAMERHGVSPWGMLEQLGVTERIRGVFVHNLYVTRAELARVGREHTFVACPYAQLQFGFPAPVDEWERAGVAWTVATDCAASNDSMSLRKELRFVAGQRTVGARFDPAFEGFLAGSGDAAAVWRARSARYDAFPTDASSLLHRVWEQAGSLHPTLRAGVLAPGALANLVVWDTDHPAFWPSHDPLSTLAMGDVDGAVHAMFVAGNEVGVAGAFTQSIVQSDVYCAHRKEANERLARLMAAL
ncbi:MAG: amidohydrolase family protein [Myxococcota bacterium]